MARQRKPMRVFLPQMLLVALLVWGVWSFLAHRFAIGIDDQVNGCLPYTYYLIDKGDHNIPVEGYIAFYADQRMEPYYKTGSRFVKQVMAEEGDRVVVKSGIVTVNGHPVPGLNPKLTKILKQPVSHFDRDIVLPHGAYWVMGTSSDAFDSRYWGPISQAQVEGQVYPIH